jgi:hypothetical protein
MGGGAITGSWRLDFQIDAGANALSRGEVAGGGTKHGDRGVRGGPYSKCIDFLEWKED